MHTLKNKLSNDELRDALIKFWKENYTAEKMTLALEVSELNNYF